MTYRPAGFIALFMLCLSIFYPLAALAISEEEMSYLRMYFKDEELEVVSSTRSLKSISRVAENMTVVTASDIELMNAHTLADVLATVNGVQANNPSKAPGYPSVLQVQGSDPRQVAAFMDGIPLNNLNNMNLDSGMVPVQQIQKIEIIKGPASSTWGSSLGGVINIITKSAPDSNKVGGALSASYGERNTSDFRADINGRKDKVGFYASAGRLQTDGFWPVNDIAENNLSTKLSYALTDKTNILFSFFYAKTSRGNTEAPEYDFLIRDRTERLHSSLSLNTELGSEARLQVSLWTMAMDFNTDYISLSDKSPLYKGFATEALNGANARIIWNHGAHSIVVGTDYDEGKLKSDLLDDKKGLTKWAFYANDTISLGKFSVTPGLRYDNTSTSGDFVSPSLGMTYEALKKTLIRADVAAGFSLPTLFSTFGNNINLVANPDLKVEKVQSYQLGIETGALEFVWLKLTAFRHNIRDAITQISQGAKSLDVNNDKFRRQGLEAELKTKPFYNTSLSAGTAYIETENRLTGEKVPDTPTYTSDIGLHYDDNNSFRALLQGNYIWWNHLDYHLAKYNAFIFDLNMIKTIYRQNANKAEVFVTAHNIFNGSQYWDYWYKNSPRWIEAGLRYKF